MKKTYNIYPSTNDEIAMLKLVKELGIQGTWWPNTSRPHLILTLTDEDLMLLKLKIPFSHTVM